ncbi:transport and Golgi organization 2 homolog [Procambarus clarkii]|uniref:transport and Golgi organization 2 homolog n=1 Tax=Procambarus clarkii TaxID=6728 RepID=UPI001E676672|nr:transport and Golgi organization 2 homolog [Procambarus clarkii]XP_045592533.1 transport and Golgi organization 2 homolog [Procambarus clarkii]XP_045592534.1 transport and Golgi organization 2 homolog [Procambarus clarkii]
MCLLFLYSNPDVKTGRYKIILVNNRDETYSRPTKPAHLWSSKIYGGMDILEGKEGGTWLGISEAGKIGCLLNIFQPSDKFEENVTSRGFLVVNYLKADQSGSEYLENIAKLDAVYNPFNLLMMDPGEHSYNITYYNSQIKLSQKIQSGVHGFGNSAINKPFKKVQKGKQKFQEIIEAYGKTECEEKLINELIIMMQDTKKYFPDEQLIDQGKGHSEDFVKTLSSIWVTFPAHNYGTRTTTVILVDHSDRVVFKERTMKEPINLEAIEWEVNEFSFNLKKD